MPLLDVHAQARRLEVDIHQLCQGVREQITFKKLVQSIVGADKMTIPAQYKQ